MPCCITLNKRPDATGAFWFALIDPRNKACDWTKADNVYAAKKAFTETRLRGFPAGYRVSKRGAVAA